MSSIKGILDADIQDIKDLSDKDLRTNVTKLMSAANKRLKRLEKAGLHSPAYREVQRTGGKFSVAGKNRTQLLQELQRMRSFYGMETSNVRGAQKNIENIKKGMKKALSDKGMLTEETAQSIEEMSESDRERLWESIDKMREMKPNDFNYKEWLAKVAKWASDGRTVNQMVSYMKRGVERIEEARNKELDKLNEQFEEKYSGNSFDNAEYEDIQ